MQRHAAVSNMIANVHPRTADSYLTKLNGRFLHLQTSGIQWRDHSIETEQYNLVMLACRVDVPSHEFDREGRRKR